MNLTRIMQNKAAVTLISIMLVCFLLFETFYPAGFLYPYFVQQEQPSTHRKRKAPPIAPPPPYTGLAPQKIVETDEGDATRDTYQRKVFYDGVNFFVVYWTGAPTKAVNYTASSDGITWVTPVTLWTFSVAPYYGGNVDIQYPNRGVLAAGRPFNFSLHFMGSNGATSNWQCMTITGQVLANIGGGVYSTYLGQGGSIVANLGGLFEYMIFHRDSTTNEIRTHQNPANSADYDASVSYGGTSVGGAQILQYESKSPFNMLCLAKGGDSKLYYSLVEATYGSFIDSFVEIATLGTGFSDFCACSEAQNVGDPERVHLVYIKSTGELCYNKFENDDVSLEKVLVVSGASYPVIASGSDGRLYVFYVKDGKIWLMRYDGSNWLGPYEFFTDEHTYNNPTYLSTNQNAQSGKICLVWTEGTTSPYEVWFSCIND